MNKHMLLSSIALFSLALGTAAFADDLNPQPEPPGVHKNMHSSMSGQTHTMSHSSTIGSATGGAGSGKSMVHHTNAGETHGFNPQPDPPGKPQTQTQQ